MKIKNGLKILLIALVPYVSASSVMAQEKEQEKIEDAVQVIQEFGKMEETTIPAQLMEITHGIVIIPKLINAGLVVGGKRGKGIALVKNKDGTWSNPVFVTLTGGSIGFQAGVQAVDLVLIFKRSETLMNIGKGSFTLGGDISVAAGPLGRSSSANTDYKLDAEVFSYSRSRGLFAGISLNGAGLEVDSSANAKFYGQTASAKALFSGVPKKDSSIIKELKEALSSFAASK
jgi:lipid-binding SYLF domain-containing protein